MKQFCILGEIVSDSFAKICDEDVCPSQFKEFVDGLGEGEPFEVVISSCGGDVLAALAIVGLMKDARSKGHAVTCHVVGLAASSASVIACAGDELVIDRDALLMIHNPYCGCEGDYRRMESEAKTLDMLRKQIAAVYAEKFGIGQDAILALMDAETWITSAQIAEYGIDAAISGETADVPAIAAKLKAHEKDYKNKAVIGVYMEKKPTEEEDKPTVEPQTAEKPAEETAPVEEVKPTEEKPVEPGDEDDVEALKAEIATLRARVAELEAEKDQTVESRVSGMQAKMQAQINAREKEFKSQLEAKEKELVEAKAKATSLSAEIATLQVELSEKTSALAEKTNALAALNAGALTPGKVETYTRESARAKLSEMPMAKRAEFYEAHKDLIG